MQQKICRIAGPAYEWLLGFIKVDDSNIHSIRRQALQHELRVDYKDLVKMTGKPYFEPIIDDLVSNTSKEFHEWLIGHLDPAIVGRMAELKWLEWWEDSIEALDAAEIEQQFQMAIAFNHSKLLSYLMPRVTIECSERAYQFWYEMAESHYQFNGHKVDAIEINDMIQTLRVIGSHVLDDVGADGLLDVDLNPPVINIIARFGNLQTLQWVCENIQLGFSTEAMDNAAEFGHVDILQWLHENRTEGCTANAMDKACKYGHLPAVKWLHDNRTEGCTVNAMDDAAQNGHLEVLKWLHQNRAEGCTKIAMDYAACYGHLEVVKWLHENRSEGCSVLAMEWAASFGNLSVVKWLHENRSEGCTTKAMDGAAMYGHLEVVKWLHENRTEGCTTKAMDWAAMYGHLETIRWLHENRTEGCTTDAMDIASQNGHFEVVKWLHFNRKEGRTEKAMREAISHKHLQIVKFLLENIRDDFRFEVFSNDGFKLDMEIVELTHPYRRPTDVFDEIVEAVRRKDAAMTEWLILNSSESHNSDFLETLSGMSKHSKKMMPIIISKIPKL